MFFTEIMGRINAYGGTGIVVLAVGLLQEFNNQVFIVNRSGSNKEH